MMDVCEILTKADEEVLVKEEDWKKFGFGSPAGPVCMLGAVNKAATGEPNGRPLLYAEEDDRQTLRDCYQALTETPIVTQFLARSAEVSVVGFNDAPGTTFADVKQAFKEAREAVCGPKES